MESLISSLFRAFSGTLRRVWNGKSALATHPFIISLPQKCSCIYRVHGWKPTPVEHCWPTPAEDQPWIGMKSWPVQRVSVGFVSQRKLSLDIVWEETSRQQQPVSEGLGLGVPCLKERAGLTSWAGPAPLMRVSRGQQPCPGRATVLGCLCLTQPNQDPHLVRCWQNCCKSLWSASIYYCNLCWGFFPFICLSKWNMQGLNVKGSLAYLTYKVSEAVLYMLLPCCAILPLWSCDPHQTTAPWLCSGF